MKWFKHMTDARSDEGLSIFMTWVGMDGYAFWFCLLEVIGAQMGKDPQKCDATYSIGAWAKELKFSTRKTRKYFYKLAELGMISCEVSQNFGETLVKLSPNFVETLQSSENVFKIGIPNLKKIKDEYSERSGVCRDNIPTKEVEVEVEEERTPKPSSRIKTPDPEVLAEIETVAGRIHSRHRVRKCSLKIVVAKLKTIVKKSTSDEDPMDLLEQIDKSHECWCACEKWTAHGGTYQDGLEKFLNPEKERWTVPPDPPTEPVEKPIRRVLM